MEYTKDVNLSTLNTEDTQEILVLLDIWFKKNITRITKAALRKFHRLSRCQVVFAKRCHYNYYCLYCHYYFFHNLSFWVMSKFELGFVTICVFKFCHIFFLVWSPFFLVRSQLFFLIWSHFFLSLVTTFFLVWSPFFLMSLITFFLSLIIFFLVWSNFFLLIFLKVFHNFLF